MVSASPAGAGLVMSLELWWVRAASARRVRGRGVVVGAASARRVRAIYLRSASTLSRGRTLAGRPAAVSALRWTGAPPGDQVAQMSVQPVECSAPFAGQFVATIRQQPEHAPVVICPDSREIPTWPAGPAPFRHRVAAATR